MTLAAAGTKPLGVPTTDAIGSASSQSDVTPPTPGMKANPRGASIVNAIWGGAYGYLMGSAVAAMMKGFSGGEGKSNKTIALAIAGWSALQGWRSGQKTADALSNTKTFKAATPMPLMPAVIAGAVGGAVLLGTMMPGINGARGALGSFVMGHDGATIARNVWHYGGPWLLYGAVGGAALGAASGAILKDPSTVWGTMKEEFLNPAKIVGNLKWGAPFGALMGVIAYRSSHNAATALKAGAFSAAVLTGGFWVGGAFKRTMQVGTIAAASAPHRWND